MAKRKAVLGLAVVAAVMCVCGALAAEDLYIEQTTQMTSAMQGMPQQNMQQKIWVSGTKMRLEMSGGTVPGMAGKVIVRGDRDLMYMVNDAQRTYMEMPLGQMANMAMPMMQDMKVDVQKTGQTRKIKQWNCTQYVITATGGNAQMPINMKLDLWVADEVKYDAEAKEQMQAFNKMMKPLMDKMKDIDGLPIETIMTMNMMGQAITTKSCVTLVRQGPIPASMFELPAGYTKQTMPKAPRGGGMPPGGGAPRPQ